MAAPKALTLSHLSFIVSHFEKEVCILPEGPFPAEIDPNTGKLPLVTRGPNKGKPVSDKLQYYKGNENQLQPMARHSYLAYMPTVEFGPGITSGSQIRKLWPTLNDKQKLGLVISLYPDTKNNLELAKKVSNIFDKVINTSNGLKENKNIILDYINEI